LYDVHRAVVILDSDRHVLTDLYQAESGSSSFDPFTMQGNSGQMSDASHTPQINPYAQDASTLAASSMFSAAAAFAHPVCR
jgi:PAB-dependent poly(A)-specific ribonuclease subunit 3